MKNVAGYDLTKLQIGGFGGFGAITELNLRLRALPETDLTLSRVAAATPWSMPAVSSSRPECRSPRSSLLARRAAANPTGSSRRGSPGTADGVEAERQRVAQRPGSVWQRLPRRARRGVLEPGGPAPSLDGRSRSGSARCADGLDDTIDLLAEELDEGLVTARRRAAARSAGPARPRFRRAAGAAAPSRGAGRFR